MSNIRQSSEQFRHAFSEMPMFSRIASLLLVAAVVVGLALLIRGNQTVETEYLFGGRTLGEQEIDSVELTFSRAKLNGWKRDPDSRRIKIPIHARSEYLSALDGSAALPMSLRSLVQEAIDKASLFEPTSQRVAREMHAKERDLGNRLTMFPEIRWASVEHDLGERSGLSGARTQSASVVVYPEGDKPLSPARMEMIREFIGGSYADMEANDVVVIDTNTDPSVCPTNDPVARKQREEEASLEQEVLSILQGFGPIRVAAYIDMHPPVLAVSGGGEPTIVRQTQTPAAVITESKPERTLLNDIIEAVTHVSSNRAARIGHQPDALSASAAKISVSKVSADEPTLQSARLSIGIPETHYQKVWQLAFLREHPNQNVQDVPALGTADLAALQQHTKANITTAVTPAMLSRVRAAGSGADPSRFTVDVWSFPDLTVQPESPPAPVATGIAWVSQSWRPMALGMLACIVIWIVVGAFRSSERRKDVRSLALQRSDQQATNPTINDELASLVDQHPELAADAIRSWIAEAA